MVFFEEFSGDWARDFQGAERGWQNWYSDHSGTEFMVSLARFRDGRIVPAPSV